MATITVLAAIAAPRFAMSLSRYRADLLAQRVAKDIELTQTRARAQGTSQTIKFKKADDEVKILGAAGLDPHSNTYKTKVAESPYFGDITSADFDGDNELIFDAWGIPDSNGFTTLEVGLESRKLSVDPNTGDVTIE